VDKITKRHLLFFGNEFWGFYNRQIQKTKDRINWTLGVVRDLDIIPERYFKHIEGTKDLFEIRVRSGSNIFRIFCFFDKGNLVVVLNGFQKKSQKTPKNEIERALRLQKQYYNEKEK